MDSGVKICAGCKAAKPRSEFPAFARSSDGLLARCRPCRNEQRRQWREKNPDREKANAKARFERNRDKILAQGRERRARNPEPYREADRKRQRSSLSVTAEYQRQYRRENADRLRAMRRQWDKDNPERARQANRDKYLRNMERPEWRLRRLIHVGLWRGLKGQKGDCRWFDHLGYSLEDLRAHLERQFLRGMSWENMGEWHIDHIVPLASFTITGPDDPELKRAWALTNLRPLWAKDNLSKGAKIVSLL